MKKLIAILAAVSMVMMFGTTAFADNPWAGDGDSVDITILIPPITEVWSDIGTGQARDSDSAPVLFITNAGGTIPAAGIAQDTVNVHANVLVNVSVELNGAIPEATRFHVLINPQNRGVYDSVFAGLPGQTDVVADVVLSWSYRSSAWDTDGYQAPNTPIPAFTAGLGYIGKPVDYAVDAIFAMPSEGHTSTPTIIWTIAIAP